MRVFISWSGERSGQVAKQLQVWLPMVIQVIRPWLSSASIDPGARWSEQVAEALQELNFGVLCLTPENINASWLLFEAGALSKAVSEGRVVPYLLDFEPRDLQGPLAQFQAVRADEPGTLRLVNALNVAAGDRGVSPESLNETFDVWWPKLSRPLAEIAKSSAVTPVPSTTRSLEDMMGEALDLLRTQRYAEPAVAAVHFSDKAETFAERLRYHRELLGFSQKQIAYRANLSPSFISRLESGILRPSAATVEKIAMALGVDISYLLPAH